jgi:hypothetical protein
MISKNRDQREGFRDVSAHCRQRRTIRRGLSTVNVGLQARPRCPPGALPFAAGRTLVGPEHFADVSQGVASLLVPSGPFLHQATHCFQSSRTHTGIPCRRRSPSVPVVRAGFDGFVLAYGILSPGSANVRRRARAGCARLVPWRRRQPFWLRRPSRQSLCWPTPPTSRRHPAMSSSFFGQFSTPRREKSNHARRLRARRQARPAVDRLESRELLTVSFDGITSAFGLAGPGVSIAAVATDSAGHVYVTGTFKGTVNFDPRKGKSLCSVGRRVNFPAFSIGPGDRLRQSVGPRVQAHQPDDRTLRLGQLGHHHLGLPLTDPNLVPLDRREYLD